MLSVYFHVMRFLWQKPTYHLPETGTAADVVRVMNKPTFFIFSIILFFFAFRSRRT